MIEEYREIVRKSQFNSKRMLDLLESAYENLQVMANHCGGKSIVLVQEGLKAAKSLVEEIEPVPSN